MMNARPSPRIPGWFIALAVLVTAAITVFAVMRRRNGQQQDWPGDPTTLPQRLTQVLSPAVAGTDPSLRAVAGVARQPMVIRASSTAPHPDRGACTLCHIIVDKIGAVVPSIRAMSSLPHAYRGGICTNCHTVTPAAPPTPAGAPAALAPMAGLPQGAPPGAWPQPALGVLRPGTAREGSWMGMDVVPITAMTAAQYKLSAAQAGVVVAEVESAAQAAGVLAGDVVVAINGVQVTDMQSFLQASTGQTAGTVDVLRGGKLLRGVLGQGSAPVGGAPATAAAQPAPGGGPPPVQPY